LAVQPVRSAVQHPNLLLVLWEPPLLQHPPPPQLLLMVLLLLLRVDAQTAGDQMHPSFCLQNLCLLLPACC
jgi:hypothetical protein